ncbi:hypothetical protein MPSEU_000127700 [Mayamaea pseudoterrestris]|nr:hypothetical protein MPSEU_000127700 [Mayamaea pseudoterrestris]
MFDNLYQDNNGRFFTKEHLACIPIVNGVASDLEYRLDLPDSMPYDHRQEIRQGSFYVTIANATITKDQLIWSVADSDLIISIREDRKLSMAPTIGTRTVAVLKINALDASLDVSVADMNSILFDLNNVNFVSQYSACSFGQLLWEPSLKVKGGGGVVEVNLPQSILSFDGPSDVVAAAQEQLLKDRPDLESAASLADSVMFCIPPGLKSGDFIANAGVNYWRANFYGEWCLSLSATMHELGHNLGLLHSNEVTELYGDLTGYMGAGYKSTNWPRKAFNAFNQWELQWYESRTLILEPLANGPTLFNLAAFTDFDLASKTDYVIINIQDTYFLNYNRAKSFNIDTEEKRNMVTVTEPSDAGTNCLVGLMAGQRYEIEIPSGGSLIIEVCGMVFGNVASPDIAVVSVGIGVTLCTNASLNLPEAPINRASFAPPVASSGRVFITVATSASTDAPAVVPSTRPPRKKAARHRRKRRTPKNHRSDEFKLAYADASPAKSPSTAPMGEVLEITVPPTVIIQSVTLQPTQPPTVLPTSSTSPSGTPTTVFSSSAPTYTSFVTNEPTARSSQPSYVPTDVRAITEAPSNIPMQSARATQSPSTATPTASTQGGSSLEPNDTIGLHDVARMSAFNFGVLFSEAEAGKEKIQISLPQPELSKEATAENAISDSSVSSASLGTSVPGDVDTGYDEQIPALIIPYNVSDTSGQRESKYPHRHWEWLFIIMTTIFVAASA